MPSVFVVQNANAKIKAAVERIARKFRPEKIILFGSRARGDARPDSDADLLVVMNVRGSRHKLATRLRVCVSGIGLPKDIHVVTPRELELYRDIPGTVIYPALREGKVLYECAG